MAEGKVTAFRFTDEELELLEVIQGHTGIRSRMEAMRTVLRYYAESKGLEVGKPSPAPKPEK
ncbi:MAG TPA: hypothetical protein VGL81_05815 [Polyangiaceae bacterium]|jgi:hypothetical protein